MKHPYDRILFLFFSSYIFYIYTSDKDNHTAMNNISIDQSHENHVHGMYGRYPKNRDSSGTSWQPGATEMPMIHGMHNAWWCMVQGYANIIWDQQRGPRGGKKFFCENMLMATAQQDINCNTVALRGMISLEPGTIGKKGYPLLLQTGETANGRTPLIDRQHPHNLFMELAIAHSFLLHKNGSLFFYFGFPGEPALGPTVYIMRFSSFYNPEAPITHHWLDSTHIQFGVITAGYIWNWLKIDGSIFTGREPDQYRWLFNRPRFDSQSIRLSANPTENWALQISYAALKSPEQLEPCVNIGRLTASASYHLSWDDNQWQTTAAWGRNMNRPGPNLDGFLLESTIEIQKKYIFFGRAESVAKDGLFIPPNLLAKRVFKVGKLNAGSIYEFCWLKDLQLGLGFSGSFIAIPKTLKPFYDGNVFSYMIFMRIALRK